MMRLAAGGCQEMFTDISTTETSADAPYWEEKSAAGGAARVHQAEV